MLHRFLPGMIGKEVTVLLSFKRVFRKSHGVDGIPVDSRDLRRSVTSVDGRVQEAPTNPSRDSKRRESAKIRVPMSGVKIRTVKS